VAGLCFALIRLVFVYTTLVNVIERPDSGEGDVAPVTREVLRKAEPNAQRSGALLSMRESDFRPGDKSVDFLKTLQQERGKTTILVEQNAKKGLEFADIGTVLVSGRLAIAGSGADLLQHGGK
jgi:hypothetical protein